MPPRFPHLFLPGPSDTQHNYTSPRRGGPSRLPSRNRAQHAQHIQFQLNRAWEESQDRQATAHVDRDGVYLTFVSEPGFDLTLTSLENRREGIRLLNVRPDGPEDGAASRATVYMPKASRGHFLRKAEAYASQDNKPRQDGTTTFKNATLIESISDVQAAVLESSFWQDDLGRMPGDTPDWVEVWLISEDLAAQEAFGHLCHDLSISLRSEYVTFPERAVLLILANQEQLQQLITRSDAIAEFRAVTEVASFFVELENRDQVERAQDLAQRTQFPTDDTVSVLILDHGVNNGHLLLEPLLADEDCHAVDPAWGTYDSDGHGTLMAGAAAFGDLLGCLEGHPPQVVIPHRLESAKILPPGLQTNPKQLWGWYTAQGISRAEIQAPHRARAICMAVTSDDQPTRGRPSSWSGLIDEVASGYSDDSRRLVILSAGNVDEPDDWRAYPHANMTRQVQDPGQAWNALTVGACTSKTRIVDASLASYAPLAGAGDLSPFSSTSVTWPDRKWPIKPELVYEGGNVARGPGDSVLAADDLQLLSTSHDPQRSQFEAFNATSAAAAQVAHLAAHIQSRYPDAWPETIRALLVHSAEWTDAQKAAHLAGVSKDDYYRLAKVCGYGVPSLERAMSCAANSLSLISQTTIQPFDTLQNRHVTRDMHLYRLPWPADILSELGEAPLHMRVTLSYFVEPSPGEVGWSDGYRYNSHGLRFQLNGPGEAEADFVKRVNRKARDDDEHPGTEGASRYWQLGEYRNTGSIHSDIWQGTAAALALSNLIAVHPTIGWWRERPHLGRHDRKTRYSLVVSFSLPSEDIDIYTPVAVRLGTPVVVPIV